MEIFTVLCVEHQDLVEYVGNMLRFNTGRCDANFIVMRAKVNTVFILRRSYRRYFAYNTGAINVDTFV